MKVRPILPSVYAVIPGSCGLVGVLVHHLVPGHVSGIWREQQNHWPCLVCHECIVPCTGVRSLMHCSFFYVNNIQHCMFSRFFVVILTTQQKMFRSLDYYRSNYFFAKLLLANIHFRHPQEQEIDQNIMHVQCISLYISNIKTSVSHVLSPSPLCTMKYFTSVGRFCTYVIVRRRCPHLCLCVVTY